MGILCFIGFIIIIIGFYMMLNSEIQCGNKLGNKIKYILKSVYFI